MLNMTREQYNKINEALIIAETALEMSLQEAKEKTRPILIAHYEPRLKVINEAREAIRAAYRTSSI